MGGFIIKKEDILDVYREEGKLKEYSYGKDYLRFKELENKKQIKEISKELSVKYNSIIRWKSNKRTFCNRPITKQSSSNA